MTWLASILINRGLSSRLAGIVAWIVAALVACLFILGVVLAIRHSIEAGKQDAITDHDKDVTIEAANRVIMAERAATANQTANASVFANAQEELRDEAHDKGTAAPVGPGVSSVLSRMRAQQAAGRR